MTVANGTQQVSAERAPDTADVIVIGGGTGGYSTALRAAALGLDVLLAERDLIGGTCLHRGCIPSKAMLHAAELVDGIAEARERWGVKAVVDGIDWSALTATRDDIVTRNHRGVEGHLAHAGVRVLRAAARLTGPRTVTAGGAAYTARRGIVLATGSTPRLLPGLVPDGHRVVTSDDALFAPGLPESVLVLGGGAIGVEYASLHRSMGARVVLVEAADRLLPLEDPDVSRQLTRGLKKRGIEVRTGALLTGTEVYEGGVRATVKAPGRGGESTLDVARLLVAVGRVPVTDGLGLAAAGLETDARGYVAPADWSRLETAVPGIHVVGDLLPPPSLGLAHASFAEGLLVAETLAGGSPQPLDYAAVPRVTYSSPQTASVGLTEQQAEEQGIRYVTAIQEYGSIAYGWAMEDADHFAKLLADPDTGQLLGAHLIGPQASSLIQPLIQAMSFGLPAHQMARGQYWIHPAMAELVENALLALPLRDRE